MILLDDYAIHHQHHHQQQHQQQHHQQQQQHHQQHHHQQQQQQDDTLWQRLGGSAVIHRILTKVNHRLWKDDRLAVCLSKVRPAALRVYQYQFLQQRLNVVMSSTNGCHMHHYQHYCCCCRDWTLQHLDIVLEHAVEILHRLQIDPSLIDQVVHVLGRRRTAVVQRQSSSSFDIGLV